MQLKIIFVLVVKMSNSVSYCKNCNAVLSEKEVFCTKCGAKSQVEEEIKSSTMTPPTQKEEILKKIHCLKCGAEVLEGNLFCGICGTKVQTEPIIPEGAQTITKSTVTKKFGCTHSDRPVAKNCINCGVGFCYSCGFEDILSDKITGEAFISTSTGASGGGFQTSKEYGTFCAKCYLERVSSPDYRIYINRNAFGKIQTMPAKKPSFLNPSSMGDGIVFIIFMILVIIGGIAMLFSEPMRIAGIGMIILVIGFYTYSYFISKKKFEELEQNKMRAKEIAQQIGI